MSISHRGEDSTETSGLPKVHLYQEASCLLDAFGMERNFKAVKVCNIDDSHCTSNQHGLLQNEALYTDSSMILSLATSEVNSLNTPATVKSWQWTADHTSLPDMHSWSWRAFLVQLDRTDLGRGMQKELTNNLGKFTLDFNAAEFLSRRMGGVCGWGVCVGDVLR